MPESTSVESAKTSQKKRAAKKKQADKNKPEEEKNKQETEKNKQAEEKNKKQDKKNKKQDKNKKQEEEKNQVENGNSQKKSSKRKRDNDDNDSSEVPKKSKKKLKSGVVVSGLSPQTTKAELQTIFGKIGEISEIELDNSDKSQPIAHISYKNQKDSESAMKTINGTESHGHALTVVPLTTTIFIRNLSSTSTFSSVAKYFSQVGPIHKMQLIYQNEITPVMAHISFRDIKDSFKAYKLKGTYLDGSKLTISLQWDKSTTLSAVGDKNSS